VLVGPLDTFPLHSGVVSRGSASPRGCLKADFCCLDLGLYLGILAIEDWCLGLEG